MRRLSLLTQKKRQWHRINEHLGRVSVDSDFDDDWKWEVENRVEDCGRISGSCEDAFLDGIEKAEIAKCLRKLSKY